MSGDAGRTIDPEFPGLAPDVVEGYRNTPETMVAEIIDGALSLLPRPRLDHARSVGELHGEGVGHVWLVSPVMQTVEVLRRQDISWGLVATFEGDAVVRAEPFDAVPLDLAALWSA